MNRNHLTKNEKRLLYGLVRYPNSTDSDLSDKIDVNPSTITSIKKRLSNQEYYRDLTVPLLNKLGCEILAVIHTQFNPVIPLEERVKTTKKTIEVFEEIFYSVGEQAKGFSISLSKNYTDIDRIDEIRTDTFGELGLLDNEYPVEVIFPFETSRIKRFFDFSNLLKNFFSIDDFDKKKESDDMFEKYEEIKLNKTEKKVYTALIENPGATYQEIAEKIDVSRHTVSRVKKRFVKKGLFKNIVLPDLKKLGFEILAFYHIRFNPNNPPNKREINFLDSASTIFYAIKKFETVIISAYPTYQSYKKDKMKKIRFLKENDLITYTPNVGKYRLENMITIKDFIFPPITKKILK